MASVYISLNSESSQQPKQSVNTRGLIQRALKRTRNEENVARIVTGLDQRKEKELAKRVNYVQL